MILVPRLAWRDSRGMRGRLALYVSAMALGVAALVAIRSFGVNLERAVEDQAREVFGSDLEVEARSAFSARADSAVQAVAADAEAEIGRAHV